MIELERALTSDSAFATPSHILESASDALVHQRHSGAPHTIYEELWHIAYWQRLSLDWANGIATPVPQHASEGFPTESQTAAEPWVDLSARYLREASEAALLTRDPEALKRSIQCPSPPGLPMRTMTIEDQLVSLAAHNAYHFGRIVLLRQIAGSWPPPSGGFSW